MLNYFKSHDFPVHLLALWWVFWLVAARTDLNEFIPPSGQTLLQYALLLLSFLAGFQVVKHRQVLGFGAMSRRIKPLRTDSARVRFALHLSALVCLAMLLLSLWLSQALTSDFVDYFARLRLNEGDAESLTGIHYLDVLTKILAFPLSYTVLLIVLAHDARKFKWTLALCVLNLLAYSYLWQVNYPLIHLFWFVVFHALVQAQQKGSFELRPMVIVVALFALLLASAVNRFGGDVLGGLQRYIVGYHLVGFSFYDHQYHDPHSILHAHSLGRSSLGFLDQMLEATMKLVGAKYQAASFENSSFTNDAIDIGLWEVRDFNAFGTFLFGFYRDFHLLGIFMGGFAYGALTTHTLYRSTGNWLCGAVFFLLASTWMMGMMVNPVEQAYFWFAIVALGAFALVNRGIR